VGEAPAGARRVAVAGNHVRDSLSTDVATKVLVRLVFRGFSVGDEDEAARLVLGLLRVHPKYGVRRGSRTGEEIDHRVTGIRRDPEDAVDEADGFWGGENIRRLLEIDRLQNFLLRFLRVTNF